MKTDDTAYDRLHFSSKPHPGRHPYRIGTIARLFDVPAAPAARARVLELGCGDGANLLAIASACPQAELIGVDLSRSQIEAGRALAAELGIGNVQLIEGGFDAVPPASSYDYVLCHGVFSWVAGSEQDAILDACSRHLAPRGVVSLSYNTLPGWRIRGIVREILSWSDDPGSDPAARISRARGTLSVLGEVLGYERFYSLILQAELDRLKREPDAYLFHEQLAPLNEPMHFRDVVGRAARRGLRFFGDARFGKILHRRLADSEIPERAGAKLAELAGSPVELEQYMDYVFNTAFRETLFCRDDVRVRADGPEGKSGSILVASPLCPLAEQYDPTQMEFENQRGQSLVLTDEIEQQAMLALTSRWPAPVSIPDLAKETAERLGGRDPRPLIVPLHSFALRLFARDAIEVYDEPPPFAVSIPRHPLATPLARRQAARGGLLVNLRHETISIGDLEREILSHCDGTNGEEDILSGLADKAARGDLVVSEGGERLTGAEAQRESLAIAVSDALTTLLRAGLLLDPERGEPARRQPPAAGSGNAKPSLARRLKDALRRKR